MATTTINGTEYGLATTLRVAYMVQGQHNHTPYADVFQKLGEMTLEDQIAILYAAFKCANPDEAKFMTQQKFLDYYLDNCNLQDVMMQLQDVIQGIMGTEDSIEQEADGDEQGK